jgi:hypothetical protein
MLLRNYDNIMSAIGLVGHSDQLKLGAEFGANNLNIKDINGAIHNTPNRAPFSSFAGSNNEKVYNADGPATLICSSNLDEPNYNDYTMTNLCNVKYVTHYYTSFEEITLDSGKKAWKRSYKILYSANTDIELGSIGVVSHHYIGNYRHILVYKEKLPITETLKIPQYTNFELSFTTIVTQNPNEPPKTEYQTDVTILEEGTDA